MTATTGMAWLDEEDEDESGEFNEFGISGADSVEDMWEY